MDNEAVSGSRIALSNVLSFPQSSNLANYAISKESCAPLFSYVYTPVDLTYNRYSDKSQDTGGANYMDIEKYIDRLDQDRRDMETRHRDMETRLREDRQASETRLREDREASEKEYREEREASDKKYREERREFEERLDKRFESIDQRFERMETKIDLLSKEVRDEGKGTRRWMIGAFIAVASMAIASIAGIVAIVIQSLPN